MNQKVTAMSILIKPVGGACNLCCSYCFYADEVSHQLNPSKLKMSEELLEVIVQKAFDRVSGTLTFAFQGGEPTLAGLPFFYKLMELEKKYNTEHIKVQNAIQTNGTLLDESWAKFLSENRFLTGISIDGTLSVHNAFRKDFLGEGSFKKVLEAANLLKKYNADFNILTVVTPESAKKIGAIYRFFKKQGFYYQQYIACLDPLYSPRGTNPYSLTPKEYGDFLCSLFDLWYADILSREYVYIRQFENLIGMVKGYAPESCDMAGICQEQWVIDADGSVYPCDFYVLDEYRLGNILENSYEEMEQNSVRTDFIKASYPLPKKCLNCLYRTFCRNGCRRNRNLSEDTIGLSYFCESYEQFFSYALPRIQYLAKTY